MKVEFLRPKFDGARFAEHTLPLEVARDLAAYEALVVDLARHLYMRENPTRQRVAKGFGADFHLHLEKVDEGSSIPVLAIVAAAALPFNDVASPYFERARDLVAACVASAPDNLPDEFPRELLTHFNQLGRSLKEDETLQLSPNAILTPQRRKDLVLAGSRFYERETSLFGTIEEADWAKSTFRLRSIEGNAVTVPMSDKFRETSRKYGGHGRFGVIVKGVGNFDSWDKLQKLVSVEAIEGMLNYELAARFDALTTLEDGWFDGSGLAPSKDEFAFVTECFIEGYPEKLDLPSIVPTQEGNLLFEWHSQGSPSVDLNILALTAEFHAFGPNDTDIEQDFELDTKERWAEFFNFLNNNVESSAE